MAKKPGQELLEQALRVADGKSVDWRQTGPCDLNTVNRMSGLRQLEAVARAFRGGPDATGTPPGKAHGAKRK